jgi:hypothetical protein
MLTLRIPSHIIERLFSLINFEIHLLVVGCYFKLIVMTHSLWLRVQENFDHVTIPSCHRSTAGSSSS